MGLTEKKGPSTDGVLIAHPTRQHAHHLARAIYEVGRLQYFFTLLPDRRSLSLIPTSLDYILPSSVFRNSLERVPTEAVHVLLGPLYFQRFFSQSESMAMRGIGELASWAIFDWWVSKKIRTLRPALVIGYEMCCVRIFEEAKKYRIPCILDAAACHYEWMDKKIPSRMSGVDSKVGQILRRRKKLEINLADKIICTSSLARSTYTAAGVSEACTLVNLPGYDSNIFRFLPRQQTSTPMRFIFVGQVEYHKGIDILIAAFQRLVTIHLTVELLIVGSGRLVKKFRACKNVKFLGKMSQPEIFNYFRESDCLVLPSRFDSFGMVVAEALASGLPVIVSENVGAAELIDQDQNGWVIPAGDVDKLFDTMSFCVQNKAILEKMSENCANTKRLQDWGGYGDRALEILNSVKLSNESVNRKN